MPKYSLLLILILILLFRLVANSKPEYINGQHLRISSKVTSEPLRFTTAQGIELEGLWMYLPSHPVITYGDNIVVDGVVEGDELKQAEVLEITRSTNPLFRIRAKLLSIYEKTLPSPHNSLVAGQVLGSKATIPDDFWEDLKKTGTAHVVVASGMNVALIAKFLIVILASFMLRRRAIIFTLIGIWLYALIAGFDAPIIRAAVMGSIAFVGEAMGRINSAWRGLLISALLMLIIRPDWISDLGFILSFVATGSLMLFEKPIRIRITKIPHIFREGLSTSLAAQIGVAPILFFTFGYFNIWFPVINALVLWTVAPVTVIAGAGGIIALVVLPLGQLIIWMVYPMTWWFVYVVEIFS